MANFWENDRPVAAGNFWEKDPSAGDNAGDKTPAPTSAQQPSETSAESDSIWKEAGRAGLEGALNTVGGTVGFVPWALDQFGWLPDRLQPLTPSNIVKGAHQLDRDIFGTTPDAPHTWAGQKAAEAIPLGAALLSGGPALLAHGIKGLATKAGVKDLVSALAKRAVTNVAAPVAASELASKVTDDPRAQVAAALIGGPAAMRGVTGSAGTAEGKAAVNSAVARGAPEKGFSAQDYKATGLSSAFKEAAGQPKRATQAMNEWVTPEALNTIGVKSKSAIGPNGENLVTERLGPSSVTQPGTIRYNLDQFRDIARGKPGTPEHKNITNQLAAFPDYESKNRLVGDYLRDYANQNPNTPWPQVYNGWGRTNQQYKSAARLENAAENGLFSPQVAAKATEGNTTYPKFNKLMTDVAAIQKGPPPKDRVTPILGGAAALGAAALGHFSGIPHHLYGAPEVLAALLPTITGKVPSPNFQGFMHGMGDLAFRKPVGKLINTPPGQLWYGNDVFPYKTFGDYYNAKNAIPKAGLLTSPYTTQPEDE